MASSASSKKHDTVPISNATPTARQHSHQLTLTSLSKLNLQLYLPAPHLCPPLPNRLLFLRKSLAPFSKPPSLALDIGTGPSAIFPLLSSRLSPSTRWIATDIDPEAISLAHHNLVLNNLLSCVSLHQTQPSPLLPAALLQLCPELVVVNPPFHSQMPLGPCPAGTPSQLVTPGGELEFLRNLAIESTCAPSVEWFSALLGKKCDVAPLCTFLKSSRVRARYVRSQMLDTGGRTMRWIVLWSLGKEFTDVRIQESDYGMWRMELSVDVARRYANGIEVGDLKAVVSKVLNEEGWGVQDGVNGEGCVDVIVRQTGLWGCFQVTVKVMSAQKEGGFANDDIKHMKEAVRRILDGEDLEEDQCLVENSQESDDESSDD